MKLSFKNFHFGSKKSVSSKQTVTSQNERALTVTLFAALLFGAYFLRSYFLLVVVAAILVYLFNPIYKKFLNQGRSNGTASVWTFFIMTFALLIPFLLIVFVTAIQLRNLANSISSNPTYDITHLGQSILDFINSFLKLINVQPITMNQLHQTVASALQSSAKGLASSLASIFASIPAMVTRSIIFIYVFLGLMSHQDEVLGTLHKLNPLGRKVSDMYLAKAGAMTRAMARGQLIIAFMDGLTDATLMYIAGFHNIFFFMLILLTFLSFIPLGGGIIVIPLGIFMIFTGHVWQGLVLVLGHILITSNIDNVMRPRFVPKTAYLQPALTMLSVFAGVAMFGILGVIVGPIIMILIVSTIDVYIATKEQPDSREPES